MEAATSFSIQSTPYPRTIHCTEFLPPSGNSSASAKGCSLPTSPKDAKYFKHRKRLAENILLKMCVRVPQNWAGNNYTAHIAQTLEAAASGIYSLLITNHAPTVADRASAASSCRQIQSLATAAAANAAAAASFKKLPPLTTTTTAAKNSTQICAYWNSRTLTAIEKKQRQSRTLLLLLLQVEYERRFGCDASCRLRKIAECPSLRSLVASIAIFYRVQLWHRYGALSSVGRDKIATDWKTDNTKNESIGK